MDGVEALRHLREWLGKEAGLPLELLTGLEKVLAEEQVLPDIHQRREIVTREMLFSNLFSNT